MWPPHKTQTRIKSTPAWLRRHQQQQRRRRRQQGGGDATILEEMEEEVEDEDDDEEEEEYENGVEPSIIKNDVSVTGTTSTQTVVSTTENSVQQRPQRPGLHRRYWSTNNAPQLSSLKAHELESSAYPSPPPPMVKPSGMERAGKLLDEKIKGRLELQQDRIDGVLDQVVDWVEVAAATLPIPATITARIGMSKVGTS
ncbi:hypothetical protein BGZ73_007257 [Actinomortierella ambigua]|nr:hypothetical protein BGZ73_007257 [Actinomortierella ambigua]